MLKLLTLLFLTSGKFNVPQCLVNERRIQVAFRWLVWNLWWNFHSYTYIWSNKWTVKCTTILILLSPSKMEKGLLPFCLFTSEFSKFQWLCILFLCVQDIRFISFEFWSLIGWFNLLVRCTCTKGESWKYHVFGFPL